jgi:hypothetical protein
MTQLSLEAQAVLSAFLSEWPDEALEQDRKCLAAALHAAADQIAPTKQNYSEASDLLAATCLNGMAYAADKLGLIATELETNA